MSYPFLPTNKYADELRATARTIATPGKGILAADESTGTIGKRFKAINVENNRTNRREYRRLLFTTPGLGQNISGAILYEETLYEKTEDGKTDLIDYLKEAGVVIGIKVDMGTRHLPGTNNELYTQGLTDLDKRCAAYYKRGARFAKWRAVVKIGSGLPSTYAINETAWGLARYAAICQANGLVPIVEPEILMDGDHSIEVCGYWTEKVLAACYKALSDQNVLLDGTLLKPNMVVSGADFKPAASSAEVALHTVRALQRSVPPAVPGITFLSGGQTEEQASLNLNAINAPGLGPRPWSLTFSYGRALQKTVLDVWQGKASNVAAAQQALLVRAKANGDANLGKYTGGAGGASASQSLFQKGYTY
jgi:fructose-bisphosphate aldolase class I